MSALDSAKVIRYGNTLPKWTADTSKISPQNPIIHRANPILQLALWFANSEAKVSTLSIQAYIWVHGDSFARLTVDQEVGGSSPPSCTNKIKCLRDDEPAN